MIGNWLLILGIGGWVILVWSAIFLDMWKTRGTEHPRVRGYYSRSPRVSDGYRNAMHIFFFGGLLGLILGAIGI